MVIPYALYLVFDTTGVGSTLMVLPWKYGVVCWGYIMHMITGLERIAYPLADLHLAGASSQVWCAQQQPVGSQSSHHACVVLHSMQPEGPLNLSCISFAMVTTPQAHVVLAAVTHHSCSVHCSPPCRLVCWSCSTQRLRFDVATLTILRSLGVSLSARLL